MPVELDTIETKMTDDNDSIMTMSDKEFTILVDLINGVKIEDTVNTVNLSRATVMRIRSRIKPRLAKEKIIAKSLKQTMSLAPLVVRNLVYFLVNKDKEVTLKMAQGMGILPKDYEAFKEILLLAASGNSNQSKVADTININYGELNTDEQNKLDRNITAALSGQSKKNRFSDY